MPITLLASLALVALRLDALSELARAAAGLPSFGHLRTLDYRALANVEATDAQRLLRGARIPRADRRIVATDARVVSARLLGSITMTVRRTVEQGGVLRPCDECHTQPAEPLPETAVQLGARPLCLGCTRALADRLFDGTIHPSPLPWDGDFDVDAACGCDLCVASVAELDARCAAARDEAIEHQNARARRCTGCNGNGEIPGPYSAHDPTGLRTCTRCGGDGVEPEDDGQPAINCTCAGVA